MPTHPLPANPGGPDWWGRHQLRLAPWLFLRNLRSTIITMIGLPVILIGTFIFFPFFGLTVNLITLLALSLCVGLVIDDAIVVRENVFRHMEPPTRTSVSPCATR